MELSNFTLSSLLKNPNIINVSVDGVIFFDSTTLNDACDDMFKFLPTSPFKINKADGSFEMRDFVKAKDIMEHVEHLKSMPSFGSNIDRIFRKK